MISHCTCGVLTHQKLANILHGQIQLSTYCCCPVLQMQQQRCHLKFRSSNILRISSNKSLFRSWPSLSAGLGIDINMVVSTIKLGSCSSAITASFTNILFHHLPLYQLPISVCCVKNTLSRY